MADVNAIETVADVIASGADVITPCVLYCLTVG